MKYGCTFGFRNFRKASYSLTGKWGQIAVPNHYNNSVIALLSATSNFKYNGKKLIQELFLKQLLSLEISRVWFWIILFSLKY